MNPWRQALREGMVSGATASLLSTAALALASRRENRRSAAPVNAIGHWIWGDRALRRNSLSWRYTATGSLVHHGASRFWATLHARAWAGTAPLVYGCFALGLALGTRRGAPRR